MAEQVGFIGLGIMGSLQAMNLAKAGYELTVFNRTREKAEAWVAEHGGTVADSPRAAITQQVPNGVHVRMAVLYHLLAHEEEVA